MHADGIQINYTANGSTAGREDFISGQTDFAASDIPFQTDPGDGSAPEHPKPGSYAYMPITAGGTVFMYNLTINGQRVTNLRLSPVNIFKIFTGVITNWDDPALAADNPGLHLPDQSIVPVVRSDGSGTSYELSAWMINQDPSLWNAYCAKAGRPASACGATSFYPTTGNMIAQNGDLGVASYVSQAFASGSIGYVNYYYALTTHFPVAQVLNAAGYYTEPTPQNVAVSLLQDQVDTTDTNNPGAVPDPEAPGRVHRPRSADLPVLVLRLPDPPDHHERQRLLDGQGVDARGVRLLRDVPGPTAVGRARVLAHADQPRRRRRSPRSPRSPGRTSRPSTSRAATTRRSRRRVRTCWR